MAVLLYIISFLPNISFHVAGHEMSLPLVRWTYSVTTNLAPPPLLEDSTARWISARLPESGLSLFSAMLLLTFARKLTFRSIPFGYGGRDALLWIIGIVAASWITDLLFQLHDYFQGAMVIGDFLHPSCADAYLMQSTRSFTLFMLIFSLPVVLAPFYEEVICRGFLYNACVPAWGVLVVAIVTSLLFSLAHWRVGLDPLKFTKYFVAGLLYFATRIRFAGIGVPIAAHMAVNASYALDGMIRCDLS